MRRIIIRRIFWAALLMLIPLALAASDSRCYLVVHDKGQVAREFFSDLSLSLVSKYIETVDTIPGEGISTEACTYQVTLTANDDVVLVTLAGPKANGIGESVRFLKLARITGIVIFPGIISKA